MTYANFPTTMRVCVCDSCGARADQAPGSSNRWSMSNDHVRWATYHPAASADRDFCLACVERALMALVQVPKKEGLE